MAAVKLVGAIRPDDEQPRVAAAAHQESEQVAGRRVGPVKVLEHQHHRRILRQPTQEAEHHLEEPSLIGRLARWPGGP